MINLVFDIDNADNAVLKSNYLDDIRAYFSMKDPLAKIKKIKYGAYVPTRLYAITPGGKFQIGMFKDIITYVKSTGMAYNVITSSKFTNRFFSGIEDVSEYDIKQLSMELRDYQVDGVLDGIKMGRGIILLATAGGKTLLMASLIETIRKFKNNPNHRTLVIVPGIQLVQQTYTDFVSYGINESELSKWSGDEPLNPNAKIIIASMSILQSKNTDENLYNKVDLLIMDECHKSRKGNDINKILDGIETNNRYGFTGSLPESKIDQWNIIGKFGPIIIEKSSSDLRTKKYITDVFIQVIKINYLNPLIYKTTSSIDDPTAEYNEEYEFLHNNEYRNNTIAKLCNNLDNNALLLVDRIEHGELLRKSIEALTTNKQVFYVKGEMDVEEREKIRKIMETNKNVICIAISSIFSTGINIKNLHYILFCAIGKSTVKIVQTIGRGLRLHENKDKLIIFDIADDLLYSNNHLQKRITIYNKERIKYEIKEIKEKAT